MSDAAAMQEMLEKLQRENEALRQFYVRAKKAAASTSAIPGAAGVGSSSSSSNSVNISFNDIETDADQIEQSFAQSQVGANKIRRPLRQIPAFSGKPGEDAETWVKRVGQLAASHGWGTVTHASYLYAGLEDRAAKWATRLDDETRCDPVRLGEALINTFAPRAPNSYIDDFLARTQLREETVNQFAVELRYLAQTAKLEAALVSRFRAGVRHELHKQVAMLDNSTSFEELVRRASEWESQLNQVKAKKSNMVAAVSEEVGYALHSTISAEVGRTVAAVMSEFKESLRPMLTANASTTAAAPAPHSGQQQQRGRVPISERVCYYCSEKGHIVRFCRAKIADEERRRMAAESRNNVEPQTTAQTSTQTPATGGVTKGK